LKAVVAANPGDKEAAGKAKGLDLGGFFRKAQGPHEPSIHEQTENTKIDALLSKNDGKFYHFQTAQDITKLGDSMS